MLRFRGYELPCTGVAVILTVCAVAVAALLLHAVPPQMLASQTCKPHLLSAQPLHPL